MKGRLKLWAGVMAIWMMTGAMAARAEDFADRFAWEPDHGLFEEHEVSLDIFGEWASQDRRGRGDGRWGLGAGANYFFDQNWGAGVDGYADFANRPYLLNLNGIFRYPIEGIPLAPYAFAGVGRQWRYAAQWTGDLGIGLEYRFNRYTGLFTDIRGVFAGNTDDYAVWRFGFRVLF